MSTRRTTRSTKQQEPTITNHFLPSKRGGSALPGKSLGDEATSKTTCAKRSLFSAPCEVEGGTPPVEAKNPASRSKPVRALFGAVPKKTEKVKKEIKEEPIKDDVKEEVVVRSIIPTETDMAPKTTVPRKLRATDLQEELAKKGAAKIHEQIMERKLNQVAEREALLKSPQKSIPIRITGGSPPKRAKKDTKKREPVKVLPTPDFLFPTKSVEKRKEQPERERSEERETSPQEDSMTRAPTGYGSSLMNDEVKESRNIPLPADYRELHKAFVSCEEIVSIFEGKTLTFTNLSHQVKMFSRKDFSIDRFAQLLAVYPHAYNVQVKQICGDRTSGKRWEHVIKPNLENDLTSFVTGPLLSEQSVPSQPLITTSPRKNLFSPMKGRPITTSSGIRIPASPRKPASPVKQVQREVVMDARKRLEGWRKLCRQQVFRCLLARRVIAAHDKFIDDLQLDSTVLPPSSSFLPRVFHADFSAKMDTLCPSIEKAQMEQFPEEDNVAGNSHQDPREFIKIASEKVTLLPKGVEQALLELRSPEKKTVSSRGVPLSPSKFAQAPRQMSVLERIKAKKAAEAAAAMRRNPELEEKMKDLEILLDKKALSLIFNIYRTSSRTSIDVAKMAEGMSESERSKRITKDKAPSLLNRLTCLAPAHFSITSTSLGKFMRVTPDNSPATYTMVESILKKEMEACLSQSVGHSLRAH